MGERAVLVEVADLSAVVRLHAALAADPLDGVDDLVPAACTVLVAFDPLRTSPTAIAAWVRAAATADPDAAAPGPLVEIATRYDGADLDDTAGLLGIRADELIARHRAAEWTVAFTGFAPGFAYLVSADWPFHVPRLDRPRLRVPAGAVGLAGAFSGTYPRDTPGGWRLIGSTDAVLFAPAAADPVLVPPRSRVRFVPLRERARVAGPREPDDTTSTSGRPDAAASPPPAGSSSRVARSSNAGAAPGPALRIVATGPLVTVQDLGRPGRAALGVARSGALDRGALRIANRLLGNDESAAALEITLGGFSARAERDCWIAVTGALADVRVDGRGVPAYAPVRLAARAELTIDPARAGLRLILAVRGGVVAEPVLGSRSTDVLARLGPPPLRAGDLVQGGTTTGEVPAVDGFPWSVPPAALEVRLRPGPRADWFTPASVEALTDASWTVSTDIDRIGIRLDGPILERTRHDELPSEGMRPGALQVPPHGRPVILLADGPVTGGYPVIGVIPDAALDALAQVRPGDRVRFRRV
ncbi:urea amidolyase family protein [uncultured Microbacterium sp.]|uniref:5-oxoprolinase subunit B/C family protein n=1 Tax=uncultured Microbacterium sp. TaxID=191216 RepID=UPI0025F36B54|nr:urea amidolyase family protein [uncultured Microbacterium sp.]